MPGGRPAVFFGSLFLCSAGLVVLLLWAFSQPHRPLEYMVAGTLATAVVLLAMFLLLVKRRMI